MDLFGDGNGVGEGGDQQVGFEGVEGVGGEPQADADELEDDEVASAAGEVVTQPVWQRMAQNINDEQLADANNVKLIFDGMRTEEERACGEDRRSIQVKGDAPDWKELARELLRRVQGAQTDAEFDQAFDARWEASTFRAQGFENLIRLSREGDAAEHHKICRDEVWTDTSSSFYSRTSLGSFNLMRYWLLMRADDLLVGEGSEGFSYWRRQKWQLETNKSSSALANDVMNSSQTLLCNLLEYHAAKRQEKDHFANGTKEQKMEHEKLLKRERQARYAVDHYGEWSNREVVAMILNTKQVLKVSRAHDPRDLNKRTLAFENGVMELTTGRFREMRKDDYILTTTGREWREPSPELVQEMREIVESMLPHQGPRKTVYSMLRLCLGAEPAEKFWILTGSGRNGKGLLLLWLSKLLGKGLAADNLPLAMLTEPLLGKGPQPEFAKVHRKRVNGWSEPTEEDEELGGKKRKRRGFALLLSNVKHLTGEPVLPARKCGSNDTDAELFGTDVLQCNEFPQLVGKVDGDAIVERFVVVHFPFTFTNDNNLLSSRPEKYKPLRPEYKTDEWFDQRYCAFVRLILDETQQDGQTLFTPFIAPECKKAAGDLIALNDPFQRFLTDHCVRDETPVQGRLYFLPVKELKARYKEATGTEVQEAKLTEKLKSHSSTKADFHEKRKAVVARQPKTQTNTSHGLLHWRLRPTDDDGGD